MAVIEIFSKATCGWAERVYAALEIKQVPYRIIPSCDRSGTKTPEFQALTAEARTPTVRVGNLVFYESSVIIEFIEEAHPAPPLFPADPGLRALARLGIRYCDLTLIPALTPLLPDREKAEREAGREALACGLERLSTWEYSGRGPEPFWNGASIGLVDLVFHTFFSALTRVGELSDVPLPDLDPVLQAWRDATAAHPAVRKAEAVAASIPFAPDVVRREVL